jgi:hypothetical protein
MAAEQTDERSANFQSGLPYSSRAPLADIWDYVLAHVIVLHVCSVQLLTAVEQQNIKLA